MAETIKEHGISIKVKYFTNRDKAVTWLLSQ